MRHRGATAYRLLGLRMEELSVFNLVEEFDDRVALDGANWPITQRRIDQPLEQLPTPREAAQPLCFRLPALALEVRFQRQP